MKLVYYYPCFWRRKPRWRENRKYPEFSNLVRVEKGFSSELSDCRLLATVPVLLKLLVRWGI